MTHAEVSMDVRRLTKVRLRVDSKLRRNTKKISFERFVEIYQENSV